MIMDSASTMVSNCCGESSSTARVTAPASRCGERGAALLTCLVLSAVVAAVASTFLGRTLVEQNRIQQRASQERAFWRARGELELAKHAVFHSTYTNDQNDVIQEALARDPSFIAGTSVLVEPAGPNRWYRMIASSDYLGAVGTTVTFVRDGTSYVSYNYYVEQHSLGVSGNVRGKVHSNQKVEFHYPDGTYEGQVSAGNGFDFLNGASAENTTFLGKTEASAAEKELLSRVDFAELESASAYVAPLGVDAQIRFLGEQIEISLFEKSTTVNVPSTHLERHYTGTAYNDDTGQWEPQYEDVEVTIYEDQVVGGQWISTETHGINGIFYFPDQVTSVGGDVQGHVTLVTEKDLVIRESIRYRDAEGDYAFVQNGEAGQPTKRNPDFLRDHSLGVIAKGDVRYSRDVPESMEINAVLMSTEGTVSFEGIEFDAQGNATVSGQARVANCLRRLGSILSFSRPIAAIVDVHGEVSHGFEKGESFYDEAMRFRPPPGFPEEPEAMFWFSYRFEKSSLPDAGVGVPGVGVVPLPQLQSVGEAERTIEAEGEYGFGDSGEYGEGYGSSHGGQQNGDGDNQGGQDLDGGEQQPQQIDPFGTGN